MVYDPVIRVDRLGKSYVIRHERRHDTLRDALADGARGALRRIVSRRVRNTSEEFWALRDVSFEVGRGEVVGIIGSNGAGKSTLLKIISRITEPSAGLVELDGRVASLLEVGTGFHPELTGRENVFLNGVMLGMSRSEIQAKFDEIVDFSGVEKFLDTPVKHYSSGMYVRLAFAVAAHVEPDILVVDEVLAVGDMAFQAKCLGKIESISQQGGRTILFVSHNVSAISRFCQKCLLLDQGELAFEGPTDEAIGRYLGPNKVGNSTAVDLGTQGYTPGAPLRLVSVAFNGGRPLVNRQPFEVRIKVSALRPQIVAGFGIGICSIDGRRIVTFESDYAGEFLNIEQPGDYHVTLKVPVLDLIPGQYRVDVGAFNDSHSGYHYEQDCAVLQVHSGSMTPPHLHGVYGDWRPQLPWSISHG